MTDYYDLDNIPDPQKYDRFFHTPDSRVPGDTAWSGIFDGDRWWYSDGGNGHKEKYLRLDLERQFEESKLPEDLSDVDYDGDDEWIWDDYGYEEEDADFEEWWSNLSQVQEPVSKVILDSADPFEAALIPIIEMNRKKRSDYSSGGDIFSNFRDSADALGLEGFTAKESALFNILQKVARLKSLRLNGKLNDPQNESVKDTVLDMAVYSIILLALHGEK